MSIVDNDNNYIMAIVCMEMEVWLDYWCSDSQASWLSIWIYTTSWVHNMYPLYTTQGMLCTVWILMEGGGGVGMYVGLKWVG